MNDDQDPKLRQVLGAWQVSPRPAPGFKSAVWRRIAAQEGHPAGFFGILRDWLSAQLPKPAYAAAILVITVVAGATAANMRAGHVREQYRLDAARRYLASIDPMMRAAEASPTPQ